jgi:4-amino-4-deoxy-L-arabinose transferase-like glycosyltransferase
MTRSAPLLLLLGFLLFFSALGSHELQGSTEARVAGIAMAMHLDNDWVVPQLFREPFLEKPPLSLWLDAGAIRVFGGSTWAVRLASAFAGLFSVMLLYGMLRKFGRPRTLAFVAGLILATMASYWSNVRLVGEDSLLTLGVTASLLGFFLANRRNAEQQSAAGGWLLFTLGIVIATLSKGVLGLAMPGIVIFVYLLSESLIDKRLTVGNWLRPGLLTLVGLIPLVIWLAVLYQRGGLSAVGEVLWANSVGRFSGSFTEAGHYEPFYYYLVKLPQAFLPWNILVYLGLWHFRKSLMSNRYRLFFSIWLVAQFTLLTLASSKRTVYLMSLTPAAAVLAAEYGAALFELARERARTSAFARTFYGYRWGITVGLLSLAVVTYLGAAAWLMPNQDRTLSFVPIVKQIQTLQAGGQQVVLFQPNERIAGATVFYTQSELKILQTDEALTSFMEANPGSVALFSSPTPPAAPMKVLKVMEVGRAPYYFVTQ